MPNVAEVASIVRSSIQAQWPHRFSADELTGDPALGEEGLGLDSIEIAEMILACEDELSVEVDESLFQAGPLTLNGLIDRLSGV